VYHTPLAVRPACRDILEPVARVEKGRVEVGNLGVDTA
jgi:hypothetical protein